MNTCPKCAPPWPLGGDVEKIPALRPCRAGGVSWESRRARWPPSRLSSVLEPRRSAQLDTGAGNGGDGFFSLRQRIRAWGTRHGRGTTGPHRAPAAQGAALSFLRIRTGVGVSTPAVIERFREGGFRGRAQPLWGSGCSAIFVRTVGTSL